MVPTLQCGFVRSNFALAMDCPYSLHARPATWLRPCCPAALGFARPYRGVGAGEGNRTLVISLEGCCSTIELHPRSPPKPRTHRQDTASLAPGENQDGENQDGTRTCSAVRPRGGTYSHSRWACARRAGGPV